MIFDWYKVINKDAFEASGLVSKEVDVILETVGSKTILVVKGNALSIVYDDVMLSIGLGGASPFIFQDRAVYLDANNDIWLGIRNDS